jgi:hypothetical protein
LRLLLLLLQVAQLDQATRDRVGSWLLRLTLKELYDWRFMQVGAHSAASIT